MIKYAVSATIDGKVEYLRKSRNKLQFGLSVNALHDDQGSAEAELAWCYKTWHTMIEYSIMYINKAARAGTLHGGIDAAKEHEAKHRRTIDQASFCVVKITFEDLPL